MSMTCQRDYSREIFLISKKPLVFRSLTYQKPWRNVAENHGKRWADDRLTSSVGRNGRREWSQRVGVSLIFRSFQMAIMSLKSRLSENNEILSNFERVRGIKSGSLVLVPMRLAQISSEV
jgi:hypothetical protein